MTSDGEVEHLDTFYIPRIGLTCVMIRVSDTNELIQVWLSHARVDDPTNQISSGELRDLAARKEWQYIGNISKPFESIASHLDKIRASGNKVYVGDPIRQD